MPSVARLFFHLFHILLPGAFPRLFRPGNRALRCNRPVEGSAPAPSPLPAALRLFPLQSLARPAALLILLAAALTPPAGAQEASPYLLDTSLGSSNVNLIWEGYWRISFTAGGGFGIQRQNNAFPGLPRGTRFFQEPDLTLTLWLDNRWFLETTFLEGFSNNTYRAGYRGSEGEFVQAVTIGNAGIHAAAYAGMEVPAPVSGTPGISSHFAGRRSDHYLMLRYDPTKPRTKTFQGPYEVKTQSIPLSGFIEGRYFILPDSAVSSVRIFLESARGTISGTDGQGTVRKYREAEAAEFFADTANGLVSLQAPHNGQVLVLYSAAGLPVGDPALGQDFIVPVIPPAGGGLHPDIETWVSSGNLLDFNWGAVNPYSPAPAPENTYAQTSRVSLPAGEALVLYQPGSFSPFERQNVYQSERPLPDEPWRVRTLIQDRGSLYPRSAEPRYGTEVNTEERTVTFYTYPGAASVLRRPDNRYPFAPDHYRIYGSGRKTADTQLPAHIVISLRSGAEGYNLGTGTVPGSVRVKINGITDTTVKVESNGKLSFLRPIAPDDWIEVSYRSKAQDTDGGDLFIYQGNQFRFTPRLTWEFAESVRWNLSGQKTLSKDQSSPGAVEASSALQWKADRLSARLTGRALLSTPNTVGSLRLFGMDQGILNLAFSQDTLVGSPAVVPQPPLPLSGPRSAARQFNYLSTSPLGLPLLQNYLWSGASPTGRDAPALARKLGEDPVSQSVMELRFSLSGPGGEWTSGDFLADYQGPVNLSEYTALSFPLQFRDDYGAHQLGGTVPSIVLQLGEIGEREDYHNDGAVNSANPGAMVQWDLSTDTESMAEISSAWNNPGSWRTITLHLSPAQQARLSSVRAFRLLIDNTVGADISGRVIMGAPSLSGSPFRTEVRLPPPGNELAPNQSVAADEIPDTILNQTLSQAFGEADKLFQSGQASNKVLRVRWGDQVPGGSPISAANRWEAVSWFEGAPLESYRSLVFYVKASAAQVGHPLTAQITDSQNRGVRLSWTPASAEWDRITVELGEKTALSARGGTINALSVDSRTGEVCRFLLKGTDAAGSSGGIPSGTVYLDEIHFKNPVYTLSGGLEARADWEYPDMLLRWGEFPVFGNIALDGRGGFSGGSVFSGAGASRTAVEGEFGARTDVLGSRLNTRWHISQSEGTTAWSGRHTLRVPAAPSRFWAEEAYAHQVSPRATTFSRRNTLNMSLAPGGLRFDAEALYDGTALVQTWKGNTQWQHSWWKAALNMAYALETRDISGTSLDYFSGWILRYAYLAPSRAGFYSRRAAHSLNLKGEWGPVSVLWEPRLNIGRERYPSRKQGNLWEGTLSVPLRFPEWSLTARYYRALSQTLALTPGTADGFLNTWRQFGQNMGPQLPFYSYLPFREILGPSDGATFTRLTRGLKSAAYTARFSLDASRSAGSPLVQLLLPSSARLSMERRYRREDNTTGWENRWRSSLGFSALNCFGRFGRYSFIPWYNSDEFNTHLQIALKDFNSPSIPRMEELTLQTNWVFTGNRSSRLYFDYRLTWNWTAAKRNTLHEGRLEYQWRSASRDKLRLPLIKRVIPRQHYLAHAERLSVQGAHPWPDAPAASTENFGFIVRHETSWVFPEAGHLKGWLAIGLGRRNSVFTNGWELGLEAEIRL